MNSQIEKIKESIDIVALIGERVKLSRSGKNYRGLCPFHGEKSPSFFVTPEMGRYKCFGCQESGDIFTFLQKYDGVSFAESLQILAKRAGVVLESIPYTKEDTRKQKSLEILSLAKEYYHYLLATHPIGDIARRYVESRNIHPSTCELFGVGYTSRSWDGLLTYLTRKKNYKPDEILETGLIIRSDSGKYYDRFRGRIMFPLNNNRGQVVGFSGRLLSSDLKEAKYVNTPETSLYHKSQLLFGYSQLQRIIREKEEVIVCEGEFDVLSSFQANVGNVVAIKGSALSIDQLGILARSAKRIIFALDADKAGIMATKRAIGVVSEAGLDLNLRVIPLQGGKDPDEIAKNDPALWREMVKKSVSVYDYLIDIAFAQYDGTTGEGKKSITNELIPLLVGISNAVEQAHHIQSVAHRLSVTEEVLLTQMKKMKIQKNMATPSQPVILEKNVSREEILSQYALESLLASPKEALDKRVKSLAEKVRFEGIYAKIFAAIEKSQPHLHQIQTALPPELTEFFANLYMKSTIRESDYTEHDFLRAVDELRLMQQKKKRLHIASRIGELERKETLTEEDESELYKLRLALLE